MNHTSRRAAANTNAERLVWYTTASAAPLQDHFFQIRPDDYCTIIANAKYRSSRSDF
ncbi:hypothetical protein ACVWWI_006478 [Bradyrhizobium sp. USDA 3686]|nr:hypothetical protein [Bradyrhizobium canariense]